MCLLAYAFGSGTFMPIEAGKDIICYKVLKVEDGGLRSPYMDARVPMKYIEGEKPLEDKNFCGFLTNGNRRFDKWHRGQHFAREGIHTYSSLEDAKTADSKSFAYHEVNLMIYECVIPKGTKYITGWNVNSLNSCYCSPKIIFKKLVAVIVNCSESVNLSPEMGTEKILNILN